MSTIDGFVLFMYLKDPMYFICGIGFLSVLCLMQHFLWDVSDPVHPSYPQVFVPLFAIWPTLLMRVTTWTFHFQIPFSLDFLPYVHLFIEFYFHTLSCLSYLIEFFVGVLNFFQFTPVFSQFIQMMLIPTLFKLFKHFQQV